jgi:hypothetical protein
MSKTSEIRRIKSPEPRIIKKSIVRNRVSQVNQESIVLQRNKDPSKFIENM